jgi:hypothetical protein
MRKQAGLVHRHDKKPGGDAYERRQYDQQGFVAADQGAQALRHVHCEVAKPAALSQGGSVRLGGGRERRHGLSHNRQWFARHIGKMMPVTQCAAMAAQPWAETDVRINMQIPTAPNPLPPNPEPPGPDIPSPIGEPPPPIQVPPDPPREPVQLGT